MVLILISKLFLGYWKVIQSDSRLMYGHAKIAKFLTT